MRRSEFPWEEEALLWLRDELPDHDPWRGWALFEFIDATGRIAEVDALLLTPHGLVLVEVKSHRGRLEGDRGTWTFTNEEGRRRTIDNPRLGADRKAKRLKGLLAGTAAMRRAKIREHDFYVDSAVFLSDRSLDCRLDEAARSGIFLRDDTGAAAKDPHRGIVISLAAGIEHRPRQHRIDRPFMRAIDSALDELGIRPSIVRRTVANYRLGEVLTEGRGYVDYLGAHESLKEDVRRVRIYTVERGAGDDMRRTLHRAAEREYGILRGIEHPGIVRPLHFEDHELGPALLFEHDPSSRRFDHWLHDEAACLTFDRRLELARSIAETLHHAHQHRVYHRAIGPRSIAVVERSGRLQARLHNWQTAARFSDSTTGRLLTRTVHVDDLVADDDRVYFAPEADRPGQETSEALDVFGLGAVIYRLFGGVDPAATRDELKEVLRTQNGLDLAAVVDAPPEDLRQAVLEATRPNIGSRLPTVADFLVWLDCLEEHLTDPDQPTVEDPAEAKAGDRIAGGYLIQRRLGSGSTSVVFLAERLGSKSSEDDAEPARIVLKVASQSRHNATLAAEARILRSLAPVPRLAHLDDEFSSGDKTVLVLRHAGAETLRERLRRAPLDRPTLERFGDELVQIIEDLGAHGVFHRDLKPENVGVAKTGKSPSEHLTLFDFSLAAVPVDQIECGTPAYIDPFLKDRRRRRYDGHAERWSVALVLHEMATGHLPLFGDGISDPFATRAEPHIDGARFDPTVRVGLEAFFSKALSPDIANRFGTTEDLLRAWRKIFAEAAGASTEDADFDARHPDLQPMTPLTDFDLGKRTLATLARFHVLRVRDLVQHGVPDRFSLERGITARDVKDLATLVRHLRRRIAAAPEAPPLVEKHDQLTAYFEEIESIDTGMAVLFPSVEDFEVSEGRAAGIAFDRHYLGLDLTTRLGIFPSREESTAAIGHGQLSGTKRLENLKLRWRDAVRVYIAGLDRILAAFGDVASILEVARALVNEFGSTTEGDERDRRGLAILRAMLESCEDEIPLRLLRFETGRHVIACVREEDEAGAQERLAFATTLAWKAREIAAREPTTSPERVLAEFAALDRPLSLAALLPRRLLVLGVAVAADVHLTPMGELLPVAPDPRRALGLARTAVLGALFGRRTADEGIAVEEIEERLRARLGFAVTLPPRPALDDLLRAVDLPLTWDLDRRRYLRKFETTGERTSTCQRHTTDLSFHGTITEDAARARRVEQRLVQATRDGGYLVLSVEAKNHAKARDELMRRFDVTTVDADRLFLDALKEEARGPGIEWPVVLDTDARGPGGPEWSYLIDLTRGAARRVDEALVALPHARSKPLLLLHPGLLERYGQIGLLARLRERTFEKGAGGLFGLWLLLPMADPSAGPKIETTTVPLVSSAEGLLLESAWVRNTHRSKPQEIETA